MINLSSYYVEVKKHGTHDQKTHAGGRGGSSSWSTDNNFTINYDEQKKIQTAYDNTYSRDTVNQSNQAQAELTAVEYYVGEGYEHMNSYSRHGTVNEDESVYEASELKELNADLDKAIQGSPDVVGDKNLYRVYSERVLADLQPGDKIVDKGFLSTTRVDITGTALSSRNTRERLGDIKPSSDTVAVIIPSPTKSGKGLVVDAFLPANGFRENGIWQREYEVLLPRNTELTFLGFEEGEMERVAVFQRND